VVGRGDGVRVEAISVSSADQLSAGVLGEGPLNNRDLCCRESGGERAKGVDGLDESTAQGVFAAGGRDARRGSGMQTDVLVVGAGPTGLMLGAELGLAGVTPVVIDSLPAPNGQAKGGVVQPRTAEVFDLRGMMD
jgi:NADPH-dependent 2,4-dienoyl-CoA reductase/sulfur reductase-like enzyme